jgi:hypothetical protein
MCVLLRLDTLVKRRSIACIPNGRMNSPNLLSALDLNNPRYRTRGSEFLRIGLHRTNYGVHEPMPAACASLTSSLVRFHFDTCLWIAWSWLCRPTQLFLFLLCTPCVVVHVHGPSYGSTYSVDVIVASSTHCRDKNYPLLVFYFILYVFVCDLCL